jgi:GntR family transcriptional regulator, colanic acid and biofilm gene transcriptional regulator
VTNQLSLEEHAYRKIREALMAGMFPPGQRLSIRQIAAALGTSPMPARTALSRLAAERAVDVLPNGRAFVPCLTRDAFIELSAIRAELEPLAVRLAARLIDRATRERLAEIILAGGAAYAASDPEGLLREDRNFLFTLYQAARAPMLLGMIESAWLRRGPHFWEARWLLIGRAPYSPHHGNILGALEAGNGDGAALELRKDIQDATTFLLERMRFKDDPPSQDGLKTLLVRGPKRRRGLPPD